jgi:hypothetical protein
MCVDLGSRNASISPADVTLMVNLQGAFSFRFKFKPRLSRRQGKGIIETVKTITFVYGRMTHLVAFGNFGSRVSGQFFSVSFIYLAPSSCSEGFNVVCRVQIFDLLLV